MKRALTFSAFVVLLSVILISCGTTCKLNIKKQLASNTWEMSTLKGSALSPDEFRTGIPFLLFDKQGKMTGSTGCNNMTGNYELTKSGIKLEPGAMTRMACQGNGEAIFLDILKKVNNIKIDGNKMILLEGTSELMTMVPKK